MRTYREIEADAIDSPAFSNGTQGCGWMANWCNRCVHDVDTDTPRPENGGIAGCPIIAVTMIGKTPAEFFADDERAQIFADYRCVEFRDKDEPGGGEPTPIPDPPGQELLLPREPFEGVRMFVQPAQEVLTL